jgi:enoyl-CoA hydratase
MQIMALTASPPNDAGPVSIRRKGAVATVSIERPEAGNAIDRAVRQGIIRAMAEIGADRETRVVILRGAGDEAFSVGSDVAQLATLTPIEAEAVSAEARTMHEAVGRLAKPVIAAIRGPCIGAGLELALHADVRFARADARFGLPSVTIGLPSGGAALARLSQLIGAGPAQALALTGGIINAERAFMLGMVSNVLSAEQFDSSVDQLAEHLAGLSPLALAETKGLFLTLMDKGPAETARAGTAAFVRCFAERDVALRLRHFYGGPEPGAAVH